MFDQGRWILRRLTAPVLALTMLAGCGGSEATAPTSSSPSTTTTAQAAPPALTRADFVSLADTACTAHDSSFASARKKFAAAQRNGDAGAAVNALRAQAAAFREYRTALRALEPPPGLRPRVQVLLASFGQAADATNLVAVAVEANDAGAVKTANQTVIGAIEQLSEQADALGLQNCGHFTS